MAGARVAVGVEAGEADVQVDGRGRLIVVDNSPRGDAKDRDGDGFDETIIISLGDAGRIISGDSSTFYDSVRAKVGDWELMPLGPAMPAAEPAQPDQASVGLAPAAGVEKSIAPAGAMPDPAPQPPSADGGDGIVLQDLKGAVNTLYSLIRLNLTDECSCREGADLPHSRRRCSRCETGMPWCF